MKYSGTTQILKEEKVRTLFDRAIVAAGTDFRSDKLWEMYVCWERDNKNERAVTAIYDRLLKIPTQLYSHHFERFCEHVKQHHPKNLVSLDEFLRLRKEIVKPTVEGHQAEEGGDGEAPPPGEEPPPGEDTPPGEDAPPPGMEGAAPKAEENKPVVAGDETEVPLLREKIISIREETHKKTEEEVSKRWSFEERIRRPYFHVKALEKAQLRNWKEYLDFEIQQGSHERVVVLFERCLIACALYEEFWLKYANYMDQHSADGVRNVFQRACQVHLPKKPTLHLAWAAFEERQNNYIGAVEVYQSLQKNIPGLAMVAMRRINLERRQGHLEACENLYKHKIDEAKTTQEKTFYAIKYARHLSKAADKIADARTVLEKALEEDKDNPKLLLQLIDLEYSQPKTDEPAILKHFERGINSTLALEHRVAFSQRKLEFLEDFGSDVKSIMDAYDSHQKLVKELQSRKKRKTQDSDQQSAASDTKKSKTEYTAPPTQQVSAATVATTAVSQVHSNGTGDQQLVSSTTDTSAYYNHAAYNYNYGAYNYGGWGQYPGYY